MPVARKLRIKYPNGLMHSIVTVATPTDDARSMICQFAFRNDSEADAPAAEKAAGLAERAWRNGSVAAAIILNKREVLHFNGYP